MESAILNKLTRAKGNLIQTFLSPGLDDFELAASYSKSFESFDSFSRRPLKVASGPEDLRLILLSCEGSKKNRTLADKVWSERVSTAQHYLHEFKKEVALDDSEELRKMVFWDLNFQLSQAVYSQICNSSIFKVLNIDFPGLQDGGYSLDDADWLGFYKITRDFFQPDKEYQCHGYDFLANGGFSCFLYGEASIILKKPIRINRNQNLVLHCENGPAVKWEDGTSLYFWNGIEVTEKLIASPETVTREDILSEQNVEVRRCYQEALGSEKFANLLGLVPLDQKKDRFGNIMTLYKTVEKDKLIGEHIHFAKVICPTTGRNYFLCVPPKISSVDEAVAWTFGKSAKEYKPERET
jgi:hypothetical protein